MIRIRGTTPTDSDIEVRKPKGEGYSTLKGFFRQYELVYPVADERDVIRLRTNYRRDPPEDVYIYRAKASIEVRRRLFLEYMHRMSALRTQPEFYNTLTTNCTTNIWTNNHVNAGRVPLSWKILASGYVPQYLYEQGGWRRWVCRSRNCRNGRTSTRAPRRLTGRRSSPDEFALGAKRGSLWWTASVFRMNQEPPVRRIASCSFAVLSPSTLHFSIRGWM